MKQLELEYKFAISKAQAVEFCKQLNAISVNSCYIAKVDDYYSIYEYTSQDAFNSIAASKELRNAPVPLLLRLRNICSYCNVRNNVELPELAIDTPNAPENVPADTLENASTDVLADTSMLDDSLLDATYLSASQIKHAKVAQSSTLSYKIKQEFTIETKSTVASQAEGRLPSVQDVAELPEAEFYQEYESQIEDVEVFKHLLALIGAKHYVHKEKKGRFYKVAIGKTVVESMAQLHNNVASIPEYIHIEIIEVAPLGWFFEIEVLLPYSEKDSTMPAMLKKHLHRVLADFSLDVRKCETRYYMDMLREVEKSTQH